MEERMSFIASAEAEAESFAELCRRYGVSRKTGYKWMARYTAEGVLGLQDRRRAPLHHPYQVGAEVAGSVLAARRAHPSWGARKIRAWLMARAPEERWPAASTLHDLFRDAGLVSPRWRRERVPPRTAPFAGCDEPNAVWTADFKGWFRTGDGARCEPFTLMDAWSRYLLRLQAVKRADTVTVRAILEAAFREYGVPLAFRSDNGPPFAGCSAGGLSRLAVWLIKLGVLPERIDPGAPQQNGRHERFHQTLKRDTASPPAASCRAQARAFAAFRREYNEERPHEALDQATPAARYQASARLYTGRLRSPEYPGAETVRQVRSNGEIKWRGQTVFLGEPLVGEPVGLFPLEDGRWRVMYGPIQLGIIDAHGRLRQPTRKRRQRPPCGFVDNASALPTTPQRQQPQSDSID
jgi:transposase InsO family protein